MHRGDSAPSGASPTSAPKQGFVSWTPAQLSRPNGDASELYRVSADSLPSPSPARPLPSQPSSAGFTTGAVHTASPLSPGLVSPPRAEPSPRVSKPQEPQAAHRSHDFAEMSRQHWQQASEAVEVLEVDGDEGLVESILSDLEVQNVAQQPRREPDPSDRGPLTHGPPPSLNTHGAPVLEELRHAVKQRGLGEPQLRHSRDVPVFFLSRHRRRHVHRAGMGVPSVMPI